MKVNETKQESRWLAAHHKDWDGKTAYHVSYITQEKYKRAWKIPCYLTRHERSVFPVAQCALRLKMGGNANTKAALYSWLLQTPAALRTSRSTTCILRHFYEISALKSKPRLYNKLLLLLLLLPSLLLPSLLLLLLKIKMFLLYLWLGFV